MRICQRDFIDGEVERGIGSVEHARRAGVQGRMSLVPTSRPELDIAFSTHDELSPCPGLALGVSDCAVGRCGDGLPLGSPGALREALRIAFGLTAGPAPDRFLVGFVALGLLAEAATERPLVCVIDDAQWLDRPSAQALAFVARRLMTESVALVFAAGSPDQVPELAGLSELRVEGLAKAEARALLAVDPDGLRELVGYSRTPGAAVRSDVREMQPRWTMPKPGTSPIAGAYPLATTGVDR